MINNIIQILQNAYDAETTDYFDTEICEFMTFEFESPLKVVIAALALKLYDPSCDTRYHQKSHGGKYCLRSIEKHTTIWCATHNLFESSCVGSLSNGLRHKEPYNKMYNRAWKNENCKQRFLDIFESMNSTPKFNNERLIYIFNQMKIKKQNEQGLIESISKSVTTSIELYPLLWNLCNFSCNKSSIIPVLIVYTYYKCIQQPGLLSLKSHNSPDIKGKSYGDIEIWNNNIQPNTIIEIKHGLEIKEYYLQSFNRKVKNIETTNIILTSLPYQRYDYNSKYKIICWNVSSFIHYNLYNKPVVESYIKELHNALMATSINVSNKEKMQGFFQT